MRGSIPPSLCSGSCASLILLHVHQGPAACHQPGNPLSPRQGTSVSLSQMVFLMLFKPVAFCAVTLTIKNRLFFSPPKSFQVCELLVLRPSHPSALQSTPAQILQQFVGCISLELSVLGSCWSPGVCRLQLRAQGRAGLCTPGSGSCCCPSGWGGLFLGQPQPVLGVGLVWLVPLSVSVPRGPAGPAQPLGLLLLSSGGSFLAEPPEKILLSLCSLVLTLPASVIHFLVSQMVSSASRKPSRREAEL